MRSECLCATYKRDRPYGNTTNLASEFQAGRGREAVEKRGPTRISRKGSCLAPLQERVILYKYFARPEGEPGLLNAGKEVDACNDLEIKVECSTRGRIQYSQPGICLRDFLFSPLLVLIFMHTCGTPHCRYVWTPCFFYHLNKDLTAMCEVLSSPYRVGGWWEMIEMLTCPYRAW